MSFSDFADAVRIAGGFLSPDVWAGNPPQPADELARGVELADLWLTPVVVDGFSESDFVSLPPAERERLREAVEQFRMVAEAIPEGTPATQEQVAEALPPFLTIFGFLRPYITDRELVKVRQAVWQVCEPHRNWIASFDVQAGWDAEGDPAVWVWLILNNRVDVTKREVQRRLAEVRSAIRAALAEAGIGLWPYISVWGRSEVVPVVLGRTRV